MKPFVKSQLKKVVDSCGMCYNGTICEVVIKFVYSKDRKCGLKLGDFHYRRCKCDGRAFNLDLRN
tara:strand:+ start:231 stop:425 length:195 start_codon:yes stop_codon:yes gene_type:complete